MIVPCCVSALQFFFPVVATWIVAEMGLCVFVVYVFRERELDCFAPRYVFPSLCFVYVAQGKRFVLRAQCFVSRTRCLHFVRV